MWIRHAGYGHIENSTQINTNKQKNKINTKKRNYENYSQRNYENFDELYANKK